MKEIYISDLTTFEEGRVFDGFFLVLTRQQRTTKTNKPYLNLILGDKSGQIEARVWDLDDARIAKDFDRGAIVKVRASCSRFEDRMQMKIEQLRLAQPDEVEKSDLLPATGYDVNDLWKQLTNFVEDMADPDLKRLLKAIVMVADCGTFTAASARLHSTQSTVSQKVKRLEDMAGHKLLERGARDVSPTDAGETLLAYARRMLALSEQAKETARRAHLGETGELHVGFTFSTPFTPLFARVVRRYRQQYPGVRLTFHEIPTQPQLAKIETRELDVEAAPLEELHADLLEVRIPPDSLLSGVEIFELRLPAGASITLVVRDGESFVPETTTPLESGDTLLVVTTEAVRESTERRLRAISRRGKLAGWFGETGA